MFDSQNRFQLFFESCSISAKRVWAQIMLVSGTLQVEMTSQRLQVYETNHIWQGKRFTHSRVLSSNSNMDEWCDTQQNDSASDKLHSFPANYDVGRFRSRKRMHTDAWQSDEPWLCIPPTGRNTETPSSSKGFDLVSPVLMRSFRAHSGMDVDRADESIFNDPNENTHFFSKLEMNWKRSCHSFWQNCAWRIWLRRFQKDIKYGLFFARTSGQPVVS